MQKKITGCVITFLAAVTVTGYLSDSVMVHMPECIRTGNYPLLWAPALFLSLKMGQSKRKVGLKL